MRLIEATVLPLGARARRPRGRLENRPSSGGEIGEPADDESRPRRDHELRSRHPPDPGTAHRFWNPGDTAAVFRTEVRPALRFASLIETMFALAADGRTNRKDMPNPLRLAVIAKAHFDVVRLPFPPAWLQRAGLALGAPLGRLAGYRATYEPRRPSEPACA